MIDAGLVATSRHIDVRLNHNRICICLTEEYKVAVVEAIAALDTEPGSLRKAINKPIHATTTGLSRPYRDGVAQAA